MKRWALVLLVIVCFVSFMGSTYAAVLAQGDMVYVRSNLHVDGSKIFWHNMCSYRELVPVGTEVKIKGVSGDVITFVPTNAKKTYYVYADSNKWDKFFVKDKKEIGLEKLSPDRKGQVENGEVVNGMTKEEVYASKGCPAYLAWGKKTFKISFNEIIKSDKWYYMTNRHGQDVMVTFENGVVIKTGGFEK